MLGTAAGVFDLSNSDHCVGSFILKRDLLRVLELNESQISALKSKIIDGEIAYDERAIHKFWYENNPLGHGNKLSFEEFILSELVRQTFPDAKITRQERIKRFKGRLPRLPVNYHPATGGS